MDSESRQKYEKYDQQMDPALPRFSSAPCRSFSSATCLWSGHNRWSKIKHDKGKNDAAKSKERTTLTLNVIRLSREGGPDPSINTALAYAINNAKKAQVSKEAIEKAVAKGQGKSLSGASLDNVLIEAMLPHGVAAIIEGQTESKNRIMADVKMIVQRAGGALTPTAFSFDKKGKVWFKEHETIGVDEAMDEAIEAGAEEITSDDGQLVVETAPELVSSVGQKMQSALGLEVERSQILFDPKEDTLARLDESQASELQSVLDQLEELDDIQEVYINAVT
ncbi:hypothetical protein PMZ80_005816 [Knufia obscura]|uniref:Transcriptional regulatory protein n=2 Tax=Knufia TaxID=430999 RepID=A0AAN8EFN1_9EURO|nr:hypothetical protein PMZ80_005816 [Knufia obscura]KAK5954483.1 hypothetical protein OHC33_004205 [Knufia fluminis]